MMDWPHRWREDATGTMPADDDFSDGPRGDDRTWGALCHLSAFLGYVIPIPGMSVLGPLLIWLSRRDESAFVDDQGWRSLNFQIAMSILWLASVPLLLVGIGVVLLWAVAIIDAVFVIIASIQASTGRAYEYPFTMELVKRDALRPREP